TLPSRLQRTASRQRTNRATSPRMRRKLRRRRAPKARDASARGTRGSGRLHPDRHAPALRDPMDPSAEPQGPLPRRDPRLPRQWLESARIWTAGFGWRWRLVGRKDGEQLGRGAADEATRTVLAPEKLRPCPLRLLLLPLPWRRLQDVALRDQLPRTAR